MLGNKIDDIIHDQLVSTNYKAGVKPKAILMHALSNSEVHTFISDFKGLGLKKTTLCCGNPYF